MRQRKQGFELSEPPTVFQQPNPTEHNIRYCAELKKGTAQATSLQARGTVACQASRPSPELRVWEQVSSDTAG